MPREAIMVIYRDSVYEYAHGDVLARDALGDELYRP